MQQRVTTQYGPGTVVEEQTVRGVTSYKVDGSEFSVWLTAAQIPEFGQLEWDTQKTPVDYENSVTLPYNPQPQHFVHDGYSTIQPGQSINPEKRTSPADSVTFEPGSVQDRFPRNFASSHTAATSMDELSPEMQSTVNFAHEHAYNWALSQVNDSDVAEDYAAWFARYTMQIEEMPEYGHDSMWSDYVEENGGEDPRYASNRTAAEVDMTYDSTSIDEDFPGGTNTPASDDLDDIQARLGDKYITVPQHIDHNSLQARLDDDPYRVLSELRIAWFEDREVPSAGIVQQADLEAADSSIRTAAWADVRAKATRLRREGAVDMVAANPTAIVARVTGDHGIYDTIVLRGSALTGSSAVSEWSCTCPWGDWAFDRSTFVGRLCSHAYATLQELRSMNMRKEKPRNYSPKASVQNALRSVPDFPSMSDDEVIALYDSFPEHVEDDDEVERFEEVEAEMVRRDLWGSDHSAARYEEPNGELSTKPGTLTPDMHYIPETHERRRIDVTAAAGGSWYEDGDGWKLDGNEDLFARITTDSYNSLVYQIVETAEGYPVISDNLYGADLESVKAMAEESLAFAIKTPGMVPGLEHISSIHTADSYDSQRYICPFCGERGLTLDGASGEGECDDCGESIDNNTQDELREQGWQYSPGDGYIRTSFLSEPFAGSGADSRESFPSSEEHLRGEQYDDVEGPGNNPAMQNADDVVIGNREAALEDTSSRDWLMGNSGGTNEFADAAEAFLRTAGRQFSLAEQQELIDEGAVDGIPFDQSGLDLRGTHYMP